MDIQNILSQKSREVWSIQPNDLVFDAIRMMDEKKVGALVVLEEGKLVGIVSERDYARKVILRERSSKETKVSEIMTNKVFYATEAKSLDECMATMTEHHIRHLPVVKDEKVIGMISIGDVVQQIIAEQKDKIESLEHSLSWGETY